MIDKTSTVKEVINISEYQKLLLKYRLVKRFYNAIIDKEIIRFKTAELLFMAIKKAIREGDISTSDSDILTIVEDKVVKMYEAAKEMRSDIQVNIDNKSLIEKLESFLGTQNISVAVKLLNAFILIQGNTLTLKRIDKLSQRFKRAINKGNVNKENKLWKYIQLASEELNRNLSKDVFKPDAPYLLDNIPNDQTEKKENETIIDEVLITKEGKNTIKEYKVGFDINEKETIIESSPLSSMQNQTKLNEIEVLEPEIVEKEQFEPVASESDLLNGSGNYPSHSNNDDDFSLVDQNNRSVIKSMTNELPEDLRSSLSVKKMSDNTRQNQTYYNIQSDLAKFLGRVEIKPKESVAITLDAPQGAGKTRLLFQLQDMFADAGYKGLFASLEEHPESVLITEKRDQYIKPQNQNMVDTIGELPEGFDTLKKLIPYYDVIFIDSWGKAVDKMKNIDFDRDLRKAFDGKLFIVIFQRTQDGKMRGGSNSQFDGDIIMKIEKEKDFKDSYAYHDKNRYSKVPLDQLKYNFYHKKILSNEETSDENENYVLL